MSIKVGVLAIQGDIREHVSAFERAGAESFPVKKKVDFDKIDALSLPGGETTTISKILKAESLDTVIKQRYREGMSIFATCAGLILLAKNVKNSKVNVLGLLDIKVLRNGYGRQKDSFEADIKLSFEDKPFKGIFIRAPRIIESGSTIVIGQMNGKPVLIEQKGILAAEFHPELTEDVRIHKYFIEHICGK